VILQAFVSYPLQLLQIYRLLVIPIRYLFSYTTRQRRQAEEPDYYDYGYWIPFHLLILLIGLAYAPVTPLILPFAACYFGGAFFVLKTLFLFVYMNRYESGGMIFVPTLTRIIFSMVIAQLSSMAALGIKLGAYALYVLFLAPIPIFTIVFYRYCKLEYIERVRYISREDAVAMIIDETTMRRFNDEFVQPSLAAIPPPHPQLLSSQRSAAHEEFDKQHFSASITPHSRSSLEPYSESLLV